jgi:hypothetical protein
MHQIDIFKQKLDLSRAIFSKSEHPAVEMPQSRPGPKIHHCSYLAHWESCLFASV